MIEATRDMEFIRTETETDALLLEANLIKKLRPRYNILLRDDKSFPYILLADDHAVPQLIKHRARGGNLDRTLPFRLGRCRQSLTQHIATRLFTALCSDSVYESRTQPCLLFQIKRCSAPCTARLAMPTMASWWVRRMIF